MAANAPVEAVCDVECGCNSAKGCTATPTAATPLCICEDEARSLISKNLPLDKCVTIRGECVPKGVAQQLLEVLDGGSMLPPETTKEPEESARTQLLRALGAEAVGTGMIVLFGCGSVCSTLTGAYSGIWQVASVWGFGVALAIYATADISGAHLNPAVTLAFQLVRPSAHGMTAVKSALYMLAQLAGAIIAALMNLVIYSSTIEAFERQEGIVRGEPSSIKSASAFGEYFPNPGLSKEWGSGPYSQDDVSVMQALFVEAWGTCVLAFVIFGLTNRHNKVGLGAGVPFMIGATVAVLLALYAPITQAGWNPARDFGPRLVAAAAGWGEVALPGPRNGFWIYIVGPFLGAPVGAFLAESLLWRRHPKSSPSQV
eukprot:TRINITY_DN3559_c0_g1_i2.p1 TRINITY_DN3559_c0_g1~~TRINITY_DN3559_c0_g1_i2.p1  ORF type:complete len:372 (+),score=64.12 TRINITY_DN3559_c0_g1_i2:63-1178(+)